MLHCGDKGWGLTTTKRHVDDYRYLAILTGSSTSILITYIVFLTEMQKGKPGEMSLPFSEK